MAELKPCPFCGGPAEIMEWEEGAAAQCMHQKWHFIALDGDNNAANEVAEAWNTRTAPSRTATIEECAKVAEEWSDEAQIEAEEIAECDGELLAIPSHAEARSGRRIAAAIRSLAGGSQ